jgi:hypothetical protein
MQPLAKEKMGEDREGGDAEDICLIISPHPTLAEKTGNAVKALRVPSPTFT